MPDKAEVADTECTCPERQLLAGPAKKTCGQDGKWLPGVEERTSQGGILKLTGNPSWKSKIVHLHQICCLIFVSILHFCQYNKFVITLFQAKYTATPVPTKPKYYQNLSIKCVK